MAMHEVYIVHCALQTTLTFLFEYLMKTLLYLIICRCFKIIESDYLRCIYSK